tara:strand:- start:210 stop:509 length:300 start_codon:yes stop_codon:yes gene_type:complete
MNYLHPFIQVMLDEEMKHALEKHPKWPTDPIHAAMVIAEEAGEVMKAVNEAVYEDGAFEEVHSEVIQTMVTCIRFLNSIEEYAWSRSEQHVQTVHDDNT